MKKSDRPRIRTELQVMFFDTDCAAVVHNIAYLRFIEIARTLLAEQLGLGLVQMAESKRYPVVVRTEIDYRRAANLGDRLAVDGWLDKVDRVRFWCAFRILRPADNALIVECRQMLAIVQMPEGKLLRLPEDWEQYRVVTSPKEQSC
jgi:YbgC/YbaW family acyl-CoA thioester hydrolase